MEPEVKLHLGLYLDAPNVPLLSPGPSHPVTQPHGEGNSSPGTGLGPLLAGTQDIPPLIWRAEHPTSGNLTTSGAGGEASFSLFFQMFGKSIKKERGGGGSSETSQKYHKRRRQTEGDTERETSGRPHHPDLLTLRTTDSGHPRGLPPATGTANKTPPNPLSLIMGETEAQSLGHPQGCPEHRSHCCIHTQLLSLGNHSASVGTGVDE